MLKLRGQYGYTGKHRVYKLIMMINRSNTKNSQNFSS